MGFYDHHLKMSASQRPLVEVRETGFLVCEQNLVVMTFMKKNRNISLRIAPR